MYFTILIDKDEFEMSEEEHEFHQRLIEQFKNEYEAAFCYEHSKAGNIEVDLKYFT